jgi:hypothetical protein
MIEGGQLFELRLSALKEEGQPKLATSLPLVANR